MATHTSTTNSLGDEAPPVNKNLRKVASCGDIKSMKAMASHDSSILLVTTRQGEEAPPMNKRLWKVASCGNISSMKAIASHDLSILLGTTGQVEEAPPMDERLLIAASHGNSRFVKDVASQDPSLLLGRTPQENTCLHISSIYGHQGFCSDVLELKESILTAVNLDKETPLITAVRNCHVPLASFFLRRCHQLGFRQVILQQDRNGFNALHHAIRNGHTKLALELIATEPGLSKHVNKYGESPMFIAAMRYFSDVFQKLLNIEDSSHAGPGSSNALHAAVSNGDEESTRKIMGKRPEMAREVTKDDVTPLRLAVLYNKIGVVRVLLKHDRSLVYEVGKNSYTLLESAAHRGHTDIAREILDYCPDAPCWLPEVPPCLPDAPWLLVDDSQEGRTCLHVAVFNDQTKFVEFILKTPELRRVINMQDKEGKTALHHAVKKCNPKIVAALLSHKDIDVTVIDQTGDPAAWQLWRVMENAKTLNWNEVCMLMLKADTHDSGTIYNLHDDAKQEVIDASRKDAKLLTRKYASSTSLVAILIATITFAAAFTLPGGYSNDAGSEGLPIMSKMVAFQAFLISDVMAMCSSFVVAFIYIVARWEDYEFLIYYRSFTKKLMWFAFMATTTAFSTGLYTVLAQRLHWLAIAICVLVASLPIFTWLLGKWPVLKLRIRLGKRLRSNLFDMV